MSSFKIVTCHVRLKSPGSMVLTTMDLPVKCSCILDLPTELLVEALKNIDGRTLVCCLSVRLVPNTFIITPDAPCNHFDLEGLPHVQGPHRMPYRTPI